MRSSLLHVYELFELSDVRTIPSPHQEDFATPTSNWSLHTPSEGRAKQQHRGRMMSPAEAFNWVIESIRQLFTTPISGWDWAQWLLALILLSCCCGGGCSFSCCRNRRRRGRYYRSNGADNNNSNADEDYDDRYHRADER